MAPDYVRSVCGVPGSPRKGLILGKPGGKVLGNVML